ncbi:hypothetical protein ABW20_dc0101297 [Dactylellina cionopaga]|nr:hypothetical protein ABW20_dc0101297 [Dactylellina cionopaga]
MKRREVPMDRFSYVNLIMYHGKQGNGNGIRRTYQEFVEAGEVVDIVVLNAVMTALIHAGEPQAAEDILTHLIRLPRKANMRGLEVKRRTSRLHKDMKELKWILCQQGFDSNINFLQSPPAPDLVSFAIFIDYHASETADFGKILSFLHGLSEWNLSSETAILQSLFKGFTLHGKIKYTPWTLQRLNAVFEAFMNGGYLINHDAALWCLRAYIVLAERAKGEEIWGLLKGRWTEQGGDDSEMLEVEHRLLRIKLR